MPVAHTPRIGITDMETRTCQRDGCGQQLKTGNPRAKYCSPACNKLATSHAARDTRSLTTRTKFCKVTGCHNKFVAANPRKISCPECDSRMKQYRFIAIDGEAEPGACRHTNCNCTDYQSSATDVEICICGHPVTPTKYLGEERDVSHEGHEHNYVLLGCGERQIENRAGLDIDEILTFLYDCFTEDKAMRVTGRLPDPVYVGFYLSYDFNHWLKSLKPHEAYMLLTEAGKKKRIRTKSGGNTVPFPVYVDRNSNHWDIDILGMRRFKLKPHDAKDWMYVCDAGPFFQTSFLSVLNDSSRYPYCTAEEYAEIAEGKSSRGVSKLDDSMRFYNRRENLLLSSIMARYDDAFQTLGISLRKDKWFGPGQPAQEWLKSTQAPRSSEIIGDDKTSGAVPEKILMAARDSYIGGWFELFCHGIIPGISWEYDLNSAYPWVIAHLPCLLHGKWKSGKSKNLNMPDLPTGNGIQLIRAAVYGSDPNIGAMMHRRPDMSITRPSVTGGWYWRHELEAAKRAGLIDGIACFEYHTYTPCDCPPPMADMEKLYITRLHVLCKKDAAGNCIEHNKDSKNSVEGKSYKLVYNSPYGKFAQSVGKPIFANPIYASLITAGCRTAILDAIATHPDKSDAVIMIATDGIYFRTQHPSLDIHPTELGKWGEESKENMLLFKPGVYWDQKAYDAIKAGKAPAFKTRGVNRAAMAISIENVRDMFAALDHYPQTNEEWPEVTFVSPFSMKTTGQALAVGMRVAENETEKAWELLAEADQVRASKAYMTSIVFENKVAKGLEEIYSERDSKMWDLREQSKRVIAEQWGHVGEVCKLEVRQRSNPSFTGDGNRNAKRSDDGWRDDNGVLHSAPWKYGHNQMVMPEDRLIAKACQYETDTTIFTDVWWSFSVPYPKSIGTEMIVLREMLDPEMWGVNPDGSVQDLMYGAIGTGQFAGE